MLMRESMAIELVFGDNKVGAMEIAGWSPEYLQAMSLRTEQIEDKKAALGLTGAEADQLINKALRQPKQDWDPDLLHKQHVKEAEEFGMNGAEIEAEARHRGGFVEMPGKRRELADKALEYARQRLFEGDAVNGRELLIRDALGRFPGSLRVEDIEEALERNKGGFIQVGHFQSNHPAPRFTTPQSMAVERESIGIVLRHQHNVEPVVRDPKKQYKLPSDEFWPTAPVLTREEFKAKHMIRKDKKGGTFAMSNSQMRLSYNVLTSDSQFVCVSGASGSGKSSSFEAVADIAEWHEDAGYRVVGLAPTGKATNNLRELGIESETIQMHVKRGVEPGTQRTLYLLDEASMMGAKSFRDFLDTIREQDRVIIAGDWRQHQSVEAGRIFAELQLAGIETYKLETIVRQRDNPELLAAMTMLRDGFAVSAKDIKRANACYLEGLQMLRDQGRILEVPKRGDRFDAMAIWYAKDHRNSLIITPDNRSIEEISTRVRAELQKRGYLGEDIYRGIVYRGVADMTTADLQFAANYRPGQLIRWNAKINTLGGVRDSAGGEVRLRAGEYSEVLSADISDHKNDVTIRVVDGFGERTITFDPRNSRGHEVYETAERSFAIGDKVQLTRAWRPVPGVTLPNRESGTIVDLDKDGVGVIDFDGQRVPVDFRTMRHADWAYALTSYSAQSITVHRAAVNVDCGDTRVRGLLSKSFSYVADSRSDRELMMFTDDVERLLSKNSPLLLQVEKPMAFSVKEVKAMGQDVLEEGVSISA